MTTFPTYRTKILDSRSRILTTVKPIPQKNRIYAYLRCSTDYQVKTNGSTEAQLSLINSYLQTHNLPPPHFIHIDEGLSGKLDNRPALDDLVKRITRSDLLIVSETSRLGRNLAHIHPLVQNLQTRGVAIHVTDVGDITGPQEFIFNMKVALAREESVQISQRVKNAMRNHAANGGIVSRPRFGQMIQDKRFVPNPHEMEVIEKIRSLRPTHSDKKIAAILTDTHPPQNYNKKAWRKNEINLFRRYYDIK